MTRYIAAHDTEMPGACLAACRTIRDVHERFDLPATFFIQGTLLETDVPALLEPPFTYADEGRPDL